MRKSVFTQTPLSHCHIRAYQITCACLYKNIQVYNSFDEQGSTTKYDGLDQGIINMGNGLLFTQELLKDFLEHASKNHITFKGYFDAKVQLWRNNLFGCEGALTCTCMYSHLHAYQPTGIHLHAGTYTSMCKYVHACIQHTHTHTHTCTHLQQHMHAHQQTHTRACVYTRRTYMHAYIHAYTLTHLHL